LSYCSEITDEGLLNFNPPPPPVPNEDLDVSQDKKDKDKDKEKEAAIPPTPVYKIRELSLAGLVNATNTGFKAFLETVEPFIQVLNLSLNDQPTFTSEICKSIAQCFELVSLDLTGCLLIDD